MTSSLGQQRSVVTRTQVTVIATQVNNLHPTWRKLGSPIQIFIGCHQVARRIVGGPVLDIFDDQNDVGHIAPCGEIEK